MMKKKLFVCAMVLVLLISVFCGCGQTSSTAAPTSSEGTDKTSLTVAESAAIEPLDPTAANTLQAFRMFNCVFSTLVDFDENEKMYGDLADEWDVSDDQLTYTFHIRDGVTFHDGTPLSLEDIVYTIEQNRTSVRSAFFANVDSVEAVGETVVIHLLSKDGGLFRSLANTYIIPMKQYDELGSDGFASVLNGTGPFRLESYDNATGNYTLKRYDAYYGDAPKLETINCRVISDASTRLIALQKGEVDWCKVALTDYSIVSADDSLDFDLIPSDTMYYVYFNTKVSPFDNTALRQAIACAIDYEAVALTVSDIGVEANTLCWNPVWGEEPEVNNRIQYDPEQAKQILADAGISTPFDIGKLLVNKGTQNIGVQIQSDLEAVGIKCEIDTADSNTWVSKIVGGDYTMTVASIVMEGSMVNGLRTFQSGTSQNYANYSSPEADALYAELCDAMTEEEQREIVVKLLEHANENVPLIRMVIVCPLNAYRKGLVAPVGASQSKMIDHSKFYWEE